MDWSDYQLEIFKHVGEASRHLEVRAVAGSGKTTTILNSVTELERGLKVLYLAFNKGVAKYADGKLASTPKKCFVTSKTFHAYGLSLLHKYGRSPEIDNNKVSDYFEREYGWMKDRDYSQGSVYFAAIGLLKRIRQSGIVRFRETPQWMIDTHCIEVDEEYYDQTLEIVEKSLDELDNDDSTIDFDDMIRIPAMRNYFAQDRQWDVVVVDEAQDLNQAQIELVAQMSRRSKVVYVGDRYQAIYGFRGSDEKSMDKLANALKPDVLKLPISYRVPSAITEFVRKKFPKIEIFSHQEGGEIVPYHYDVVKAVKEADIHFLLSATNKTLVEFWFDLLAHGVKSTFKDKDVLIIVRKWLNANTKKSDTLESTYDRAKSKLLLKKGDTVLFPLVKVFIDRLEPSQKVSELHAVLDKMEEQSGVELHTIHSAKGLESDSVLVVDDDWFINNQLENMQYVAYTRALNKLLLFRKEPTHKTILRKGGATTGRAVTVEEIFGQVKSRTLVNHRVGTEVD